jgi:hypothetical protein
MVAPVLSLNWEATGAILVVVVLYGLMNVLFVWPLIP